jgi:hypothetical protein
VTDNTRPLPAGKGRPLDPQGELIDALSGAARDDDLVGDIAQDIDSVLDRCEAKLIGLERRVRQNLYRAARERIAHERGV